MPQSHRAATYGDHGDFKSPKVAVSRSVVAAQSPSCGHTETKIYRNGSECFCTVREMRIVRLYTKTPQRVYCDCTTI